MEKKTFQIDAEGKILGRLASEIAKILQGKNSPHYAPEKDCEHFVEIKNVTGIKVSGQKAVQKEYKHFSGYPGGLKSINFAKLFAKSPQKVLSSAVLRMLPKNRLQKNRIKRLKFI
ncbi:MAG: 50S ribosomal protein L13 [Patescibacteria group bacterium]